MKHTSSKYKARSMRNTNPSHTKTIRGSKLRKEASEELRKETSESPSLLKAPAHCSTVVNEAKEKL